MKNTANMHGDACEVEHTGQQPAVILNIYTSPDSFWIMDFFISIFITGCENHTVMANI